MAALRTEADNRAMNPDDDPAFTAAISAAVVALSALVGHLRREHMIFLKLTHTARLFEIVTPYGAGLFGPAEPALCSNDKIFMTKISAKPAKAKEARLTGQSAVVIGSSPTHVDLKEWRELKDAGLPEIADAVMTRMHLLLAGLGLAPALCCPCVRPRRKTANYLRLYVEGEAADSPPEGSALDQVAALRLYAKEV